MTAIGDKVICGKRGGPTFVKTLRVDPIFLKCPPGTQLCSEMTDPSASVCMTPNSLANCPIIDLVIEKSETLA